MLVLILVGVVSVLATALYLFLDRRYSVWKRRGVPGPPASVSLSVPKLLLGQESMGDIAERIYSEFRDSPIAGSYVFGSPVLHLHDPEVIKHVLIKDFQDFNGRGGDSDNPDPLASNLFLLHGARWRNLRVKLAPTFTSGKIKYMFDTFNKCSENMADYLSEKIAANGGKHTEDARPLMIRLFVDTICSVVFGIESNVIKNPDSEFFHAALEAVKPSYPNFFRALVALFGHDWRKVVRTGFSSADSQAFFTKIVEETVEYREKNNVERPDMMNLLIQLKNKGFVAPDKEVDSQDEKYEAVSGDLQKLDIKDVTAQVFVFFLAGFESSSGTTSFTLYEMAKQPAVLAKALEEVDRTLKEHNGKISYESVMSMTYLDKCVSETLRMYPPLGFVSREAMVTRKVPLTDVTVDKGTRVVIPIHALHYDPKYWPNPNLYDPERFSEEQKKTRPSQVYLPFGDGPRICIAARLGVAQIKTALVTLLAKFTVVPNAQCVDKVKLHPRSFATAPQYPLNLTFVARSKRATV
ncbi:cytochrome P450 6k1-like [Thrips palmi]|uniref:Cytochrome P450 6k1-like n=1 Tax=Thrips palmi TaxID=161013 RepID=A0A6P8YDX8_THRPL|nr:cytochrome P450 6k1-like [Thrips palmi]